MGNRGRTHGRVILVVITILVGMALPGAAEADTIGSPLFGESTPVGCAENTTCILSQGRLDGDVFNNVVSEDGTITGFTFRHVTGDVKFVVLREEGASGYAVVDSTDAITGSGDDEDEAYTLTPGIRVRQGDFIGLALDANATVGARDATGEDTNLLELTDSSTPALAADDRSAELFLRATWEPTGTDPGPGPDPIFEDDDDGSFSTAVPDPLAALKAGARPKVKISAKAVRASKKYSVAITVRNPNGYRVKGRLSLKAKGLKLGSKAFSITAESSKSVRVKLSGKARKRLARKRKMKITASASFKGPIGKAGSAKQSITVKAPKRPKPKKRTPSGGGGGGGGGLLPRPFCVPHIEYDANGWAHAVPC